MVVLPDDLEKRLRARIVEEYGNVRGAITIFVAKAIKEALDKTPETGASPPP